MTTGSSTSAPRVKVHPYTPGFWMDYYTKVKTALHGLNKEETSMAMQHYILGHSVEQCVEAIMIGVAKDVNVYLQYKYKVGDLVGRPLKKDEVELTLDRYIEGKSAEDCAKEIKRKALM